MVLFFKPKNENVMETEKKISADILKITMTIRDDYPELSKYLNEMEVTIPSVATPKMTNKVLLEYYNSLETMLKEYVPRH